MCDFSINVMNDVLFQLLEFPGLTDHCHKVAHICNTIMIFSMKLCLKVLSNTKFLPHKEISSSSTCRMRKKNRNHQMQLESLIGNHFSL